MENSLITEKIKDQSRSPGVVVISKLTPATRLLIETIPQIYEVVILRGEPNAFVYTARGGKSGRMQGNIVGCVGSDGTFYPDVLMHGHKLVIHIHNTGRQYTELMQSIRLDGDGWSYSLWDGLELPKINTGVMQGM